MSNINNQIKQLNNSCYKLDRIYYYKTIFVDNPYKAGHWSDEEECLNIVSFRYDEKGRIIESQHTFSKEFAGELTRFVDTTQLSYDDNDNIRVIGIEYNNSYSSFWFENGVLTNPEEAYSLENSYKLVEIKVDELPEEVFYVLDFREFGSWPISQHDQWELIEDTDRVSLKSPQRLRDLFDFSINFNKCNV